MITGSHSIIYSADSQADIAFFKDVLKFPNVDVGNGWLIFGLPPSEIAVHPVEGNSPNGFYLLCDDIDLFVAEMAIHKIECSGIESPRWGRVTHITLPGGGKLGVYEPRHARP